jgi:hypothetical protein
MSRGTARARLGSLVIAALAPLTMGAQNLRADLDHRILLTHNHARAEVGVPPLRWNPALAASARVWADHLAATGKFQHAPEDPEVPQGENLWAGARGRFAPEAMTAAWIAERRNFKPGLFPDNSKTGRVEDVGHYTQLVWRDTREVGCALAVGQIGDILVCRYAEAGNYRGERPF